MEDLDIGKLLQQTFGEMEEDLRQSTLAWRVEIPDTPMLVHADGQRLYRVFQNLIRNCDQYALEGSRVYVNLTAQPNPAGGGLATVMIRNISRNEITMDADHLTARFVRGDQNRTTEGSGLGLSIAKSFTEACGGRFNVHTDGDLFIVTVQFPLVVKAPAAPSAPAAVAAPQEETPPAEAQPVEEAPPPPRQEPPAEIKRKQKAAKRGGLFCALQKRPSACILWMEEPIERRGNMVQVPKEKLACLEPLFAGWEETLVWSVVQGCMGKAWADSLERPRAALLWVGDFLFLGGNAEAPVARKLAGFLPRELANGVALAVPQNESWLRLLEEAHGKRGKPITRYAIRKEPGVFDPGKLRANLEKLPQGFTLEPIDEGLYHALLELDWARDFCAQFGSWEEYAAHGCGFVAIKDGQVAAGASSYTWYRGGIEIEIDTKAEYRRQGLALCCASALLLHCLERGLYPSWDAATPISVALAEKLGYHFSHAYPCLEITVPHKRRTWDETEEQAALPGCGGGPVPGAGRLRGPGVHRACGGPLRYDGGPGEAALPAGADGQGHGVLLPRAGGSRGAHRPHLRAGGRCLGGKRRGLHDAGHGRGQPLPGGIRLGVPGGPQHGAVPPPPGRGGFLRQRASGFPRGDFGLPPGRLAGKAPLPRWGRKSPWRCSWRTGAPLCSPWGRRCTSPRRKPPGTTWYRW